MGIAGLRRMGKIHFLVVLAAAGCAGTRGGSEHGPAKAPVASADGRTASCVAQRSVARPLGGTHMGSSVALADIGGKTIAYVADEDGRSIEAVDVDAGKVLATTPLDGAPSQLMVLADGRVVVLLRDTARLAVLEAEAAAKPLALRCSVATDAEPVALAATKDDGTLFVSAAWGQSLSVLEGKGLAAKGKIALPREPRAIAVADDDKTAYVSHAVGGVISVVDLGTQEAKQVLLRGQDARFGFKGRKSKKRRLGLQIPGKPDPSSGRMSCQSFALAKSVAPGGRILAPQVFVDPGEIEQRTEGYGDASQPTEVPGIAVLDEGTRAPIDTSLAVMPDANVFGPKDARDHKEECLLPRAAATDPRSRSLLVACAGIDTVIAYDASSGAPETSEKRRWVIGAGPTGLAVDPKQPRAFAWSQFDRTLSTLDMSSSELIDDKGKAPHRVAFVAMPELASPVPAAYALGRNLFHAVGDTRISKDGRACASCHPDGRDDAITWATPDGPRRSILLAGRVAKSSPFSWTGGEKTLQDHLANTFDRLGGGGLKSLELDALVTYITQMKGPAALPASGDPKVTRGAAIFASKEAACADCHATGTFADGARHDVQSRATSDRTEAFDTPSLRFVGGSGPYFHDGRYKSLHELLRDVDGKMGHTKQLTENDLDALESYLRTL
jgi:DNA-binding beta-propeller fold protein YncE/mono/diheme cytochrome c family protein